MPAEVDALVCYPAEANTFNMRLRDVLVEVDAFTRVCAVLLIVALAPHGGRKGQENYTASRALILGGGLFQRVATLKESGRQVRQANGVQAAVGRIGHGAHKVGGAVGAFDEPGIA